MKKLTVWSDLEALFSPESNQKIMLFKHSLICGVSSSALEELMAFAEDNPNARILLLEIQPFRDLSNEVARRSGIPHRSPQVFVIQEGRVLWHASHWKITAKNIAQAMEQFQKS